MNEHPGFSQDNPTQPPTQSPNQSASPSAGEPSESALVAPQQLPHPEALPTSSRLHWSSLFFDIVSHSRNYLVPALIALFSAAQGNNWGVIIAGLFFLPSLVFTLFRFFTLKYRVHDRKLVVEQGLIFRSVRTVPVAKIQNIDLVQNVMHRLFGVGEVRIETASGSEPEAVLRVLTLEQVEQLRNEIFGSPFGSTLELDQADWPPPSTYQESQVKFADDEAQGDPAGVALARRNAQAPKTVLIEIQPWWLILAGLASNRGMIMVGIGLGLMYQFDVWERVDFRTFQQWLPNNLDRLALIGLALIGLILAMCLLRILSIAWYILRFFGYRLTQRGDDLQISCGLLTKVSATVPRKRIQLINVYQSMMMKWLGLTSLRIETAGGTQNQEDASQSVSRRWFLPVMPESELPRILESLRPGFSQAPIREDLWVTVAPRAFYRKLKLLVVVSVLVGALGGYFLPPWGWLLGLATLLLTTLTTYLELRSIRYARLEQGIVFVSGYFTQRTSYTFFDKLQTLRVDQSPFDKRWRMAKLTIDTAGAGPAEHALSITSLRQEFAFEELQNLRKLAARHLPEYAKPVIQQQPETRQIEIIAGQ